VRSVSASQHERVETVVLVARLPVAAAQILQLVRADHDHRHPGREQHLDDLPVAAFDRDLARLVAVQPTHQLAQPGASVRHGEPLHHTASGVDDGDRVIVFGPVDPGHPLAGFQRQQPIGRKAFSDRQRVSSSRRDWHSTCPAGVGS
jgi:hypothetical protein